MRGFIFANEWIFDMERPQKREKTNEIDTFQLRKVKIVNQKNTWIYFCEFDQNSQNSQKYNHGKINHNKVVQG